MAGNLTEIFKAADAFMEAAVVGRSWSSPLMLMAQAMGATSGILSRLAPDLKTFAQVTTNLNEPLNLLYSGKIGYMPPGQHIVRQYEARFITDNDDLSHQARKSQPFHQDFLHKCGLDWRCAAMLEDTEDALRVSFYRTERQGPFDLSEVVPLNSLFRIFRASALVSHTVLDQQARLAAAPFEARGEKVYYLGRQGKIIRQNDAPGNTAAIKVVRDRLATDDAGSQRRLDAAIHLASGPQHQPAITMISDDRGPSMVVTMPILGEARDIFRATTALAIVIDPERKTPDGALPLLLRSGYKLTPRETEVAGLVAGGFTIEEAAAELQMNASTGRLHLKSVLQKIGVRRQAELTRLLARFNGVAG